MAGVLERMQIYGELGVTIVMSLRPWREVASSAEVKEPSNLTVIIDSHVQVNAGR
jgi:hypothetical protein